MGPAGKNDHPAAGLSAGLAYNVAQATSMQIGAAMLRGGMPDMPDTLISLSEAEFRRIARDALRAEPPEAPTLPGPSDYDLNPGLEKDWPRKAVPRPAAVLVPVVTRERLTVLFTQRTDDLPSHAGQISFPGGKVEPGDIGPADTAQREAEEEIGLQRSFVEPIGFLDPYLTGTGFRIVPVVALVRPGFTLQLDASEVAAAFEVPLDFLMNAENHERHARTFGGTERYYHAMPFEDRYIWGATAGILKNMHERFFA
jgi:8-oxo-dGTP pyrophosphatase MutT (NUDIX family)